MSERRKVSWWRWILTCVVLYGVYLLFVSTLTKPELFAALGCTLIATLAAGAFGTVGIVHFKPTLRELLQIWSFPYYALLGVFRLVKATLLRVFTGRVPASRLRAVPFDVGDDTARAAARRALAVTYTTLSPNSVVLGIAHKQKLLLYHQLVPDDVPRATVKLGARP